MRAVQVSWSLKQQILSQCSKKESVTSDFYYEPMGMNTFKIVKINLYLVLTLMNNSCLEVVTSHTAKAVPHSVLV
jgi:hypothetical protein